MENDTGPSPKDDPDPNVPTPNAPTGLWGKELELDVELARGLIGVELEVAEETEGREVEGVKGGVTLVPVCIAKMSFSVTYSGNVCTYSSGP
jgi:hypothetical protein